MRSLCASTAMTHRCMGYGQGVKEALKIRRNLSFAHCALCKSLPYVLLSHKCPFHHLHQASLFISRIGTKEKQHLNSQIRIKKRHGCPSCGALLSSPSSFSSSSGLWLEVIHVEGWRWSSQAYIISTVFL